MKNRGQLSLFAVLGIVILIVIVVGLYFRGSLVKSIEEAKLAEREALTQEEKAVAKTVDDCVEKLLEESIFKVSGNGGYYPGLEDHMPYLSFMIPFYYDKGKENLPSIDEIAESKANYINERLESCLSQDIEVLEPPKTEVKIGKTLKAEVEMVIKVKQSKLKKFSAEVNINYQNIYTEMKDFYSVVKKFNGSIDALEIGRYVTEKNYKYSYDSLNNASFFFMIWENYYKEKPLIFSFGIIKEELEEFDITLAPELFIPIEEVVEEEEEEEEVSDYEDELAKEDLEPVNYNSTKASKAGDFAADL